jgi:hypothetical protein
LDKASSFPCNARHSTSSLGMRLEATLAVFVSLLLSGCADPIPPIAQGLPRTFGPTPDFDARIRHRFPIGSGEVSLIDELRTEKFDIAETQDSSSQYRRTAQYHQNDFPCGETWTVRWVADKGQIMGIEGKDSGQLCY